MSILIFLLYGKNLAFKLCDSALLFCDLNSLTLCGAQFFIKIDSILFLLVVLDNNLLHLLRKFQYLFFHLLVLLYHFLSIKLSHCRLDWR
jgi:hypothetical protein